MTKLELYDCTLREGEQAAGASFTLEDRVELFKLLANFGFDFIELGWPIASDEIMRSFELCKQISTKAKIVAFGSTSINPNLYEDKNLASILSSKADYACIFGKTHIDHVVKQLKLTPQENLNRISQSVAFLKKNMPVFYDAEHFFDAFKQDKKYALETLVSAAQAGAERLVLCDTNGGLIPCEALDIIKQTKSYLDSKNLNAGLGVHFHNDCGLALANVLSSLPYVVQAQGTINGIGERIGNLNFSEFIPVYMKKLKKELDVRLETLKEVNERSYHLAGIDIPESRAFVGDSAFAHKGGVHVDATNKGASYEHENPSDFGNKRVVLLNTLGGASCVLNIAEKFGYTLNKKDPSTLESISKLFVELRDLEQRGYRLGAMEAEQYLLIGKYFGNLKNFLEINSSLVETTNFGGEEVSKFYGNYNLDGKKVERSLKLNGGPIDAAYKNMQGVLCKDYPKILELRLVDFHVGIARSRAEESTVRTVISFEDGERFKTVGVDKNIIQSAVEALAKGFNYYLNRRYSADSNLNKYGGK
jgi:2-isopropylmalate synthase